MEGKFEVENFEINWDKGLDMVPNIYIRNATHNIFELYERLIPNITLVKITWFKKTGEFPVYYDVGEQPLSRQTYTPWDIGGSSTLFNWDTVSLTVLDKHTIIDLGLGTTKEVIHGGRSRSSKDKGRSWISVKDFNAISQIGEQHMMKNV